MTISEKEEPAICYALRRDQKANELLKVSGRASIIAGIFLIVFGWHTAKTSPTNIEPSAVELTDFSDQLQPIKFETTFESDSLNGRIANADQSVFAKRLNEDRLVENLPDNKELLGKVSVDSTLEKMRLSKPELKTEVDDKSIWLSINRPEFEVEWLNDVFTISHYTYALESDPLYSDDDLVSVPGLPEGDLYKAGFIFGGRGILQQGTGLAENGRYITIDWDRSYHDPVDVTQNRWFFRYGIGRPVIPWKTVATHHPDLPQGTQIIIESYLGEHRFIVADGGLDLAETQIDIFIGPMTIAEADQFGIKWSRVAIIRPVDQYELLVQELELAEQPEVAADEKLSD